MTKARWFGLIVLIIVSTGILMVYSSSHIWAAYKFNDAFYYLKRQLLFGVLGLVMMLVFARLDYHWYFRYRKLILMIGFLLLGLVLMPGVGSVRGGSRSWFGLGPLSFQPSELFKVAIIIYMAHYLSKHYTATRKLKTMLLPLLLMMGGFLLIMCQPDFGTGCVMALSVIVMIMVTAFPFKYFLWLAGIGVLGVGILILSAPYRLARITAYLDPFSDPLGSGFQMIQSLYAIGPGGLVGVGFDQSFQKHFYLPEPQTDFIFAIFCEEFGFLGGVILIGLFGLLLYLGVRIALTAPDSEGSFLGIGIIGMIAIQIMINLGVVVGLLPVTGITLPFMSYGGSSLVILMSASGIIMNIARRSQA